MSKAQLEQARVHIDRRQIEQAIPLLLSHLNDDFNDEEAIFILAACYLDRGMEGMGAALNRIAIQIRADKGEQFPEALKNMGACFKAANKTQAAQQIWEMALEIAPNDLERGQILSNIGGLHVNAGTPAEGVEYFNKSLAYGDSPAVRFNRGMAHLELGNWEPGWDDYDAGFASGDRTSRNYKSLPEWGGAPGDTVIVWGEQGIGDEIMFASCLPDLVKISKRVIFDCHPRLVGLFKRSFPDVEIHGTRKIQSYLPWLDEVKDADASICLSSLMTHFRRRDEDFPRKAYLKAEPTPAPPSPGHFDRPRIGISWFGGTKKLRSDLRSIALPEWVPILKALPEAEFYSLQYTPEAAKEVCELEEQTGIRVRHYPGWVQCTDYDRTASFVASMDLVITVSTSAYHLANALGVPTWCLVSNKPAWRYGAKGHLLYPETLKYYRQPKGEGWDSVIKQVAHDLAGKFSS